MLDRILDERLKNHAGHDHVQRVGADVLGHLELGAEADDLDVEILVDRLELLPQRHEMIGCAQQAAQEARQFRDEHARRLRLRANQRRDRRQRVEQKMRVDLIRQRLDFRRQQQLLLLLQSMFDPRVVPDLDRRRDGQHRRQHHDDHRPREAGRRRRIEQPVRPARPDPLAEQLQRDGREQQDDLPVHLQAPQHLPRAAG